MGMEIRRPGRNRFQNIFTFSNPMDMPTKLELTREPITEDENENISRIPTQEEIKDTIFAMAPLKAPSPNSLPVLFYKKCWDTVKEDVVRYV